MSEQETAPPADIEPTAEPLDAPVDDESFGANGTFAPSSRPNVTLDPDIVEDAAVEESVEDAASGEAPDEPAVDEVPVDEVPVAPAGDEPTPVPDDLATEESAADTAVTAEPAAAEPTADAAADPADPADPADSADADGAEATAPVDEPTLDLVDPDRLRRAVEAVLLVVDEPVEVTTLAQTLAVPKPDVLTALTSLRDEYDAGERGIDLREVAGGWRLYTREEFAAYVERFVLDGQQTRLTQAALETLSVIAYRQPVTRSRVSAIRGVGVDGVMRTLTSRGLVEECGTDAETGGGLYRTTSLFLEKLGLNSLEELPPLAPLLPDHTDLEDPALSDG